MQNLHLLEFLVEAPFSMLGGPSGTAKLKNGAHGTEKLLQKNSNK